MVAHRSLRHSLCLAFLVALSIFLLFPAQSLAHAILLRSDPAKDAILTSAPSQIRMWFSEDLNPIVSKAVIVNAANQKSIASTSAVSKTDVREMDVTLQGSIAPGTYVVVWRTQSADDGHVLSGSLIFRVANPDGTVPNQTVTGVPNQNLLGNTSNSQFDGSTLFSMLMIFLVDLGAIFWVGAQLWRTFVLQADTTRGEEQYAIDREAEQRFEQRFSLPTLLVIFLANIGIVIGQSLVVSGGDLSQALNFSLLTSLVSNGRFGTFWLLREAVVLLALLSAAYTRFARQESPLLRAVLPWLNLLLGLSLLIAITLSGHAAAVNAPIIVYAVLIDWLHLLAAALWVGGMLYLAQVYIPTLQGRSMLERTRALLIALPQFTPLALTGVIVMAVTGPFNAVIHISSLEQLFSTAYGRTLLIKDVLVGALLLVSAIHVGLFRPQLSIDYKKYALNLEKVGNAGSENASSRSALDLKELERRIAQQSRRLSSTLRWEPLLGVAVLLCTALLNVFASSLTPATPPPTPQQQPTPISKPYNTTMKTSDNKFTIKLNVTPNRFGPNVFTVTVLDSTGKTPKGEMGVSVYTTMLDMDMGTDSVNLQPDGKGNFKGTGDLGMGGDWQLRIQIRTLDNTLHETKVKIFTPY